MATSKIKEERGGAAVAERPSLAREPRATVAPQATVVPQTTVVPRTASPAPAASPLGADRFRPRSQNWDAASPKRHQMGSRRPKGLGRAKALGRRSPEAAAVAIASFVVTLLCLYVGAYARVTAEGFEKERLMETLREAHAEEDALHSEVSRLKMPDSLRSRAGLLGLIPGDVPGLNLVTPSASVTLPVETTPAAPAENPKEIP